jgi:hypothetical protein
MDTYPQRLFEVTDLGQLDEFIAAHQEEHLHLDFKLAKSTMTRDDRKNLAKAVSGFANADGGVIVWGVDAKPNADGIDCAVGKSPISPLSQFMSQLALFTGEAANPIVDGVIHRKIEESPDAGYVVTYVPASDGGPHMAKLGEDRYFKRSGGRFAKMEHYEVADLFGRRQRPLLKLTHKLVHPPPPGCAQDTLNIILGLDNSGRGSARAPYIDVKVNPPFTPTTYGFAQARPEVNVFRTIYTAAPMKRWRLIGKADFILHPGLEVDLMRVWCPLPPYPGGFSDLTIEYQLAAENYPLQSTNLIIRADDLSGMIYAPSIRL